MHSPAIEQKKQQLTCPNLPLAVYREVVAHLRQVAEIDAGLIMRPLEHDESQKFDYYQSQVAALEINYGAERQENAIQQVNSILNYYAQRYQPWIECTAK